MSENAGFWKGVPIVVQAIDAVEDMADSLVEGARLEVHWRLATPAGQSVADLTIASSGGETIVRDNLSDPPSWIPAEQVRLLNPDDREN